MLINRQLFHLFLMEIIALCLIFSFKRLTIESTIVLAFFNLLFVVFIFQINGTLNRKLSILAIGNIFGLFLNTCFFFFVAIGVHSFGNVFENFADVIFPFLNTLWVVPYWSFSLGLLPRFNDQKRGQPI